MLFFFVYFLILHCFLTDVFPLKFFSPILYTYVSWYDYVTNVAVLAIKYTGYISSDSFLILLSAVPDQICGVIAPIWLSTLQEQNEDVVSDLWLMRCKQFGVLNMTMKVELDSSHSLCRMDKEHWRWEAG